MSDSSGLLAEFGLKKNLVWRVEVPTGWSSPIVVKDRIYVTGVEGDKLIALALDRQTGRAIWRRDILRNHTNKIFVGNDSATPTPTSDGETIYAFFPDLGLISFNAAGEERWRIKLGPFDSFYGLSSSPVVEGNTVALVCDNATDRSRSQLTKTPGGYAGGSNGSWPRLRGTRLRPSTRRNEEHIS